MKASPWLIACLSTLVWLTHSVAQEVVDLSLYRAGFYEQLSDAEPQPIPETPDETPFYFLAVMAMSEEFLSDPDNFIFVRGTILQPPSGSLRALDFLEVFGGFVDFRTYTSAEALQSANRDGSYTFTFSSVITGDSEYGLFVPDGTIPQPARVLNFAAAQAIDPQQSFVLSFSPESPAVGRVRLEVYSAADGQQVYDSGPLAGVQSTLTLPAGTLQPGTDYIAEIAFTRLDLIDEGNFPSRSAGSVATTRLPLKASSGEVPAPQITGIARNDADELVLTIQCTSGVPLSVTQAASLSESGSVFRTLTPESSPVQVSIQITQINSATAFFRASQ